MRTVLKNLLERELARYSERIKKYGVSEPMYLIISGRMEAYREILSLLKGDGNENENT